MAGSAKVVRRGRPTGSRSIDPKVAAALGKAIASLRVGVGMSQEALALAANVGRSNISMIETGRMTPNFVGVVRIAAALNCSLPGLMQEFEHHYAEG
ncbi:MAG: transcriptional regulator [Methylibium sp.]|nr:transcriptional regulator [Methylibium sp.]